MGFKMQEMHLIYILSIQIAYNILLYRLHVLIQQQRILRPKISYLLSSDKLLLLATKLKNIYGSEETLIQYSIIDVILNIAA
jgi:hypothetical protein